MTPRPWTDADRATLARMARAGYSDAEIARHLGRDRRTVCDQRRKAGIAAGIQPAVVAMMARLHKRRLQIAA